MPDLQRTENLYVADDGGDNKTTPWFKLHFDSNKRELMGELAGKLPSNSCYDFGSNSSVINRQCIQVIPVITTSLELSASDITFCRSQLYI